MWWKHLRAVLIGPVMVTVAMPVLLTMAADAAVVEMAAPLRWLTLAAGVVLILAGVAMLVWTISLFHRLGRGTLSPLDPPRTLVVSGPYRHVRNPMFLSVLAILLGESLAIRAPVLLAWFALFFAFLTVAVPLIGERGLARRFGAEFARYRAHVPRWLPMLRPWQPEQTPPPR